MTGNSRRIDRADGHEATREQEVVFDELALGCAMVMVQRMAPIGSGRFRAVRFATDGTRIDAVIVYPNGDQVRDDEARAA